MRLPGEWRLRMLSKNRKGGARPRIGRCCYTVSTIDRSNRTLKNSPFSHRQIARTPRTNLFCMGLREGGSFLQHFFHTSVKFLQ